jgi:hypothetical protein
MDKNNEPGAEGSSQGQAPDDSLGLDAALASVMAKTGITTSTKPAVSAAGEADEATAHSQDQTQTDTSEADETAGEAGDQSGEEQGEQGQADAEAQGDGDGDGDGDEPEWFQKRIGKLTARAKAAEERTKELEAEVQALKTGGTKPSSNDPGEDPEMAPLLERAKTIRQEVATATNLRAQIAKDPEAVAQVIRKVAPNLPNYEPETLRDFLNDYIGDAKANLGSVEGQVTERRKASETKRTERQGQVMQLTTAEYPWVKDTSDPRGARFAQLLKDPVVARAPDAAFFIAAGLEKLALMESRKPGAKPAAAAPAKPTVRPPGSGRPAPARTEAKDPLVQAREQMKSGNPEGAKAYARAAVLEALQK